MKKFHKHWHIAACAALLTLGNVALAQEASSFAVSTELKATSDQRTRGISDSLNRPALKLSVQMAHESGLVGLIEMATVSTKQFLDGNGLGITLGGGYRAGNPDGWHYGAGLATEVFPNAKLEAPHTIDATGNPGNWKTTSYNNTFAMAELGYGAFDARLMNVVSKNYRGADTGGVCGAILSAATADPTQALECFARGDHNSKGSWLLDLGYKYDLSPNTKLNLHAGYQKVANFSEANTSDYAIGVTHKRWGFDWTAEWLAVRTKARELFLVDDGGTLRATDNNKLLVSVSRTF